MMPIPGPLPWDREQRQYSRDHRKHRRSSSESYGYPHQEYGVDMRISGSGVPIWREEYYRPYPVLNLYPYPHNPYLYHSPRWIPDFRTRPVPIGFEVWHEDYGKQGPRFYPEHGGNRFVHYCPNGRNLDDERLRVSRGKRYSRVVSKKSKPSLNKKVTKSSFHEASGRQNDVGKQKSVDVLLTCSSNVRSKSSASCDLSQPCELLEKNDGLDTPVSSQLEEQYENNDGLIETVSSNVRSNPSASFDLSQPSELLQKNDGHDTPVSSQPEEQYENNNGLIETVSSNVCSNPSASCDLSQPCELLEKNDGLDTPVSSQPEEQCENSCLNETVSSSHELEKSNSIGVNWKAKWKQPGSLLSRSYCFRRTSNSKSIDDDCKKVKIDVQQGHGHDSDNLVADIHVPKNTETCTMSLEEMGPCKKRRLGWGEGLAMYEKKKIEHTDDFVSENEMVVCSNNRGPSPVTEHKRLMMDRSILDDNANVAYQYHLVTPNYQLENADLMQIARLNSAILDLPLSDDSSFVTSKLLALKGDVLKALELIESDIDKIECELKSLPQVEIIYDQSSSPVDCVLEYTHNENDDSQVTCQRSSLDCIVQNKTPHDVEAYSLGKRLFSDLENVHNAGGNNDYPIYISDVEYKGMIKAKFLARKRFVQFKERVLAIKYRDFKRIWKEVHFLSKKEFRMKYQKKIDLSFPTPNGRYGKRCSSIHSRSARHKHLTTHAETINFIGKLISSNQVKPMRNSLKMPALILDDYEKKGTRFITNNGLIEDPWTVEKARSINFTWTEEQKEIFMDKLSIYGKDFTKIAFFLHKTTADCVEFYYKNHKADWFRRPLKKEKNQHGLEGNGSSSFDNLHETTLMNGNTDDGMEILRKDASEKVDTILYKASRNGSRLLLKRSVGVDFDENESQTVGAADLLDGIRGSLSPEGSISSCVTSAGDFDPRIDYHEREIMNEMDYADWTDEEKCNFIRTLSSYLGKDFETISGHMKTRTGDQCKIFFSKTPKCAYEDCGVDSGLLHVFIKNSDLKTERYLSPHGPVPNTLDQNNVSFDLGFVDSKNSLGVSRKMEMPKPDPGVGNGRSHGELLAVPCGKKSVISSQIKAADNSRNNSNRLYNKKGNNKSSRNLSTLEHDSDAVNRISGQISSFDGNAEGVVSNARTRNGDISCKRLVTHFLQKCNGTKQIAASKSEHLVLPSSENLGKNKLISQSDPSSVVVKPHHQSKNIKLFTQIITNPSSQQKQNQTTRQHRNNENRPETKLGSEIPQPCNFSFRDESKIRSGFKNHTVSPKIEQQLPLHEINGENRNSDGLTIIPTRKIRSTNRVFRYQMTNNREVQHFDIDMKKQQQQPPLPLETVFPKKQRSQKLRLGGRKKTKQMVEIQPGGYTKYHKR